MTSQDALAALKAHDHTLLDRIAGAPPSLPDDIAASLDSLDQSAQVLAVAAIAKQNAPTAGKVLLSMTGGKLQPAAAAAQALLSVKAPPPAADILAAAPKREDPDVRGFMYLAAGKSGDKSQIETLHALVEAEKDPGAHDEAQAAAVKLGSPIDRPAFIVRVQTAAPDQVLECTRQLLYIADPTLAKAMTPWLSKEDNVMRLGSDRPPVQMARMKDMAVWTSHQLGVKFPITPEYLTNYSPAVVQECLKALAALPQT